MTPESAPTTPESQHLSEDQAAGDLRRSRHSNRLRKWNRYKPSVGQLLAGAAILLCGLLILVVIEAANTRYERANHQLQLAEVGYAKLHAQVVAMGGTPAAPTLPVLLESPVVAAAAAPPQLIFPFVGPDGSTTQVRCVDPSADGVYKTCTISKITPPPKP